MSQMKNGFREFFLNPLIITFIQKGLELQRLSFTCDFILNQINHIRRCNSDSTRQSHFR